MKTHYHDITQRVWEVYHSADKVAFRQSIANLETWALNTLPSGNGLDAILKLCQKSPEFILTFDYPSAYRTSNMIDRHMDGMDRSFYSRRYFHGHLMSMEYSVRAWALLHNFQPYCPRAKIRAHYQSPAHRLNGFVYHENWLQNLLVSTSLGGFRR